MEIKQRLNGCVTIAPKEVLFGYIYFCRMANKIIIAPISLSWAAGLGMLDFEAKLKTIDNQSNDQA